MDLTEYVRTAPDLMSLLDGPRRESATTELFTGINAIFKELRETKRKSKSSELALLRTELHDQKVLLAQFTSSLKAGKFPNFPSPPPTIVPGPSEPVRVVKMTSQNRALQNAGGNGHGVGDMDEQAPLKIDDTEEVLNVDKN